MCEPKPPRPKVSAKERKLRLTIEMRKGLGFRHDRAYVRRVNSVRANRRRAGEGYPPLTRREDRYLRARDRLTQGRGFSRLIEYTARHRGVFGEISIEDAWPRPAYLRVPVTRDLARHRAAVTRFGLRFRMVRVRWSTRQLLLLQRRVHRDEEALAAEDIHLVSTGLRADDRLTVEVATRRPDARAALTARYGPAARVLVVGETPRFLDCRRPERYEAEPDGVTLKVHWTDSGSIDPRHIEVIETADTVYLGAVAETGYSETADARPYVLEVTLSRPLGERAVKTIEYEHPVKPGPPPRPPFVP